MGSLDNVSLVILLGSLLVLAGILSSLIAMRFGAPLLLVFLLVGVLAGENGPGGIKFDDVGVAYTVGSIALALILFDGGLHALCDLPQCPGAGGDPRNGRRSHYRNSDGASRKTRSWPELDRGLADRRRHRLDGRGRGVFPAQCPLPAAPPALPRDARSGIGVQRALPHLSC